MYQRDFRILLAFYFAYIWLVVFSRSILPTYFLAEGITLREMMAGIVFSFVGQIVALLSFKKLSVLLSWRLALVSFMAFIALIVNIASSEQFYLAMAISGLSLFFFFVPYNIAHFEATPAQRRGESSAVMFIIWPLISVFAPLLAGFLATINITLIWIFSIFFFLMSYYLIRLQKNFQINYSIKEAIEEIKATRTFIFFQGVWEALAIGIIPVYTLFFIKTPLSYGAFATYLAVIGVISNLLLGRLTDRLQKRVVFLYPLTIALTIITLLFPLATSNLQLWAVATAAISFLLPLFWNVSTAMVVDTHPNLRLAIPGREFMLALGRATGLFLTFISFSIEKSPKYIFFVLGAVILLYPLNLYWNTKIKKNFSYL